jgi:hypothetical protein
MPDIEHSDTLNKSLRLTELVVQAIEDPIVIAAPVLSCPINIGINLFGERLFEELEDDPDGVDHALRIITDVILKCFEAFNNITPGKFRRNSVANWRYMPEGFGFIDGCATQMISPRHYDRFFAHLDQELLRAMPNGGMIHLCGASAQHMPAWKNMPEMRALQLNDRATDDFELYWNGSREDQILYVDPTEKYPVERILDITKGKRVVIEGLIDSAR